MPRLDAAEIPAIFRDVRDMNRPTKIEFRRKCRRLGLTRGLCVGCGKPILRFHGHHNCVDCVAAWEKWNFPVGVNASFSKSDPKKENPFAYRLARAWRGDQNVMLCGPKGVGKTYLAECLLNEARERMTTVAECRAIDFHEHTLSQRDIHKAGTAGGYAYAEVLLIDDLDKAPWNEKTLQHLWAMFDIRARRGTRTILTSNFAVYDSETRKRPLEEFFKDRVPKNQSLGASLMDRLQPLLDITMDGDSLRDETQPQQALWWND